MEQLHNYARVHHALQMPASNDDIDASAYLRELCRSISRSKLEHRNIELVLVECAFRMSSDRCWLMGMIVAELITNAVRHASTGAAVSSGSSAGHWRIHRMPGVRTTDRHRRLTSGPGAG